MKKMPRKRVLIIGIDAATFDVIEPLAREGSLPNIAALMRGGAWGRLASTVPPVTPPAWVSFMTGKNPGKHGVFDFFVPPSYGYTRGVLNSRYIKSRTIWGIISEHGRKVGVINLPMTHPPEAVNGFLIPGMQYSFDGAKDFSYPPELMEEIREKVGEYRVLYGDLESLYTDRLDRFIREWREITDARIKTILYLMEKKDWDVLMPVFYSIDVMQHHFWKHYDPTHPLHDPALSARYGGVIPEFYRTVDSAIGEMLRIAGDETAVVVVSDHGAGAEEEGFSINNWLSKEGFLSFRPLLKPLWKARFPHLVYKTLKRLKFPIAWTVPLDQLKSLGNIDPREGLHVPHFIDWKRTKAYGGNHTEQGIYINLKGREPGGIVERGAEYEKVRDSIIARLRELRDNEGRPVEVKIFKKEEVMSGPYTDDAPDIFVELKGGTCLMQKEIYHKNLFHMVFKSSGTHRMEGVAILKGEGIRKGVELGGAAIVDLAPTILYMLGLPVPEDMDGRVLEGAFEKGFVERNAVRFGASSDKDVRRGEGVVEGGEAEKIKEKLRDLGYFG